MTIRRGVALLSLSTLGALVLLQLEAEPARAHTVVFAQSKIHQRGEVVRYELAVSYHELSKRIEIESTDSSSTPPSASTDADRNTALRRARAEVESYLGSHVQVALDSKACDPTLNTTDVMRYRGELFAVLLLAYRCPPVAGSYESTTTSSSTPEARST